ncbi:MAG: hypothetical protein AAF456_14430 [Planctomycetota bacterium]
MAFHVPFEHRRNNRNKPGPIYIGFDQPRRRRGFNGFALLGFLTTVFSLGILSPIGLLLSLIGMRKQPRRLAKFTAFISGIGTLVMAGIFGTAYYHHHLDETMRFERRMERQTAVQVDQTRVLMAEAADELEEYKESHDGKLPSEIDCNMLMIKHVDPWGNELRFDVQSGDESIIRSAGPDGEFNSRDDVTTTISGETEYEVLLPMD